LEGIIREEPGKQGKIKSGRNERGLFKKDNRGRESREKTRKFTNLDKE